jgi:hypothetical protein
MRRLAVAIATILGLGMAPSVIGAAADTAAVANAAAISAESDFNNDGFSDLAIGIPGGAGAVDVLYGSATGLTGSGSQQFTQDSPGMADNAEQGDRFGGALTTGDFNDDGLADLAIGVAGEDIETHSEAGAVHVLYGNASGLGGSDSQYFTQNSPDVGSSVERSDFFGDALGAGDFNNDGFADLAIGVPSESSNIFAVGAVNVLYGGATGLTGSGSQYFTQNSPGVGSTAEKRDHFGSALATGDFDNDGFAELAIGVPQESIGSIGNAGTVNVLHGSTTGLSGSGSQTFTQNSAGVGGSAEGSDSFGDALTAGDFDNDGFAELAIGVPQESSDLTAVGAVNVLNGSAAGLTGSGSQFFSQDSPGVGSTAELFDEFGSALAAGDFNNDGFAELAIGVPSESGSVSAVGAVNVLNGSAAGLRGSGSQYFTQNSPGVWSTTEAFDLFGDALAAGDFDNDGFDELAIGVRLEDISSVQDAGAVNVLCGTGAGLTGSGSRYFTEDSPGVIGTAEERDQFGMALAASGP